MKHKASHRVSVWFLRHLPRVWRRWWAARLIVTVVLADRWIGPHNPTFTRKQNIDRFILIVLVFLTPIRLPISINSRGF